MIKDCMVTGKLSSCSEENSTLLALSQSPFIGPYLASVTVLSNPSPHSLRSMDKRIKYFSGNASVSLIRFKCSKGVYMFYLSD